MSSPYKPLNGSYARYTRNSKALECAARYILKQGRPLTASTVYQNMTFKNGNLYRTSKNTRSYHEVTGRMLRNPLFKRVPGTSPILWKVEQRAYDLSFPHDPLGGGQFRENKKRD
jgi:hypothetical protein